MCEGSRGSSNGGSENATTDPTKAGHDLQEGVGEPFEPFVCQICLDIAYKPVVLQACGHVFCFWCIRRSMNERKPSQCPACRRPYLHFPRVCRQLHFLLEKAWPLHYQRKASETLAMEQATAVFSPRILPLFGTTPSSSDHSNSLNAGFDSRGHKLHVYPELAMVAAETTPTSKVGVEDVSCSACRNLLYRPVVINCGEALCEGCWKEREAATSNPSCGGCGGVHRPVRLCLALHHFLERAFSSLYSQRRLDTTQLLSTTPATPGDHKDERQVNDVEDGVVEEDDGFVHVGVGCDGCGMFPIISHNRYHCVECGDKVGYDLCEGCYNIHVNVASAKACCANDFDKVSKEVVDDGPRIEQISPISVFSVGRFNQQHSVEHQLVAMASAQRACPATFGIVLQFLRSQVGSLQFDLHSGTISRRRRTHQIVMDDFDDYIDNLV
ncbi:hypothetical protein GOP47_0020052 [Adiantum capillus-veneris]|uniref:E3 ubiquitin-protein ligase PRT1 n=1 Tax=Adiantum capillus-veneris TaxID=13818 RepID=A0A9D4UCQ1_ADICA|nr:hypothetical protein GOP47_0020052 [Adiantum capillus-veneris]